MGYDAVHRAQQASGDTMSPSTNAPDFGPVFWPALLLTVVALAILGALHAVVPAEAGRRDLLAQPVAAPNPALALPDGWQPFRTLRRAEELRGGRDSPWTVLRFEFDAGTGAAAEAIFIPTYDHSVAAWVNGRFVGEAGSITPPIAINAYHPALFRLRPEDLRPGTNTVDLVVAQAVPGAGIVHAIHVGSLDQLEAAWRWVTFASIDVLRIYNGLFVVLGAFALYVYLQLRRESVFLWFVLLIACCGLRNLDLLWPQWPQSQTLRAVLVFGSSLGILLSCSGFVNRLIDRRSALDRWLLLAVPPLLLLFWWRAEVDLIRAIDEGYAVLRVVFAVVAPLMLWRLVAVARRLPQWRLGWMLGCLCMAVVFVAHDVLVMWLSPPLDYQYSLLASLPMISAFVIAVAQRYVESARQLEASHAMLAQRVRETEQALQISHEQLRVLEREQARADERQRIMRDMHDGVGGQLAALVMTLRRDGSATPELANRVEASLNDLRLIIDSLDDVVAADLRTALALFRERTGAWMRANGLACDFDVDLPDIGGYGPRETLQVLRILQEACGNVVKHAAATSVRITARWIDDATDVARPLRLTVSDNGRGFDPASGQRGRGMHNMRRRAEELGGRFTIDADANGTHVAIALPRPSPTR
jgi:signal transduction histidine kinase